MIYELEGLRGLLALWVFVFHIMRLSGFTLPVVSEGFLPVDVFMILSGFMIGRLRVLKHEPYLPYLARRAARIYPAYLIALACGIAVMGLSAHIHAILPWTDAEAPHVAARHASEVAHFWPHLWAHLTLLHGMFPEGVLDSSALAFLGAAWSLSLEWQFYLVAPFIVAGLLSRRWRGVVMLGIALLAVAQSHIFAHMTYLMPAFLPQGLAYFVVGIASALVFEPLRKSPVLAVYGALGVFCMIVASGAAWLHPAVPFMIWTAALLSCLRTEIWGLEMVSRFLTCAPVKFLGRVSYGFYLYHAPVYTCVAWALLALGVSSGFVMVAGLAAVAFPVTFALSALSYFYIEIPVMHWAKKKLSRTPSP